MKSNSKKDGSNEINIDERCHCGQLLARLTVQGVELKCRRCKRIHMLEWRKDCKPFTAT